MLLQNFKDRFLGNQAQDVALGLLALLPHECVKLKDDEFPAELKRVVDYYSADLPHPLSFPIEYEMWIKKWKQHHDMSEVSNKLVDSLKACSPLQFPNMNVLFQLALTLPISCCEAERRFSQLKLIKT